MLGLELGSFCWSSWDIRLDSIGSWPGQCDGLRSNVVVSAETIQVYELESSQSQTIEVEEKYLSVAQKQQT